MLRSDGYPSVTYRYDYFRTMRIRQRTTGPTLVINLAPMGDSRHTDEFRLVIDDVHYAPVTDPDAPLIFVAL
jgi:hypothetical protein